MEVFNTDNKTLAFFIIFPWTATTTWPLCFARVATMHDVTTIAQFWPFRQSTGNNNNNNKNNNPSSRLGTCGTSSPVISFHNQVLPYRDTIFHNSTCFINNSSSRSTGRWTTVLYCINGISNSVPWHVTMFELGLFPCYIHNSCTIGFTLANKGKILNSYKTPTRNCKK